MPESRSRSRLHVEGTDDKHAILHLLIRHGVDYDQDPWPPSFPSIRAIGGKDDLLEGVEAAVRLSNNQSIGFVLDANSSLRDRWKAVSSRLCRAGVDVPNVIPREGFIGESQPYRARVGVWLMPDNQREGALENFLRDLVEEKDPLLPYAEQSTKHAKKLGAGFADNDGQKAVLHTWLAWQEESGRPYGTAIRARYFRDESPAAQAFVAWFRTVFNVPAR